MAASKKKKVAGKTPAAKKKVVAKKPVKKAGPVKKIAAKAKKIVAKAKKVLAPATSPKTKTTAVPKKAYAAVLKPLENRLLVTVEGASERTAGGLYIPASASVDRPTRGQVVAKGPGKRNKKGELRPLDVGVGDSILFPEFAGTKITLEGRELLILTEDDVLAIAES